MTNITVTNTYQDASGFGLNGTVTFTPVATADDGGTITYIADPVHAKVTAGALSKSIVTTDTYDVPGTVTYRVVERIGASYRRRYYVEIPSSLGSSVVLGSLQQFSNPPNTLVLEGIGDVSAAIGDLGDRLDVLESYGLLSTHIADTADPHSAAGYLTQDVADTLYGSTQAVLPPGGTTGQVLAKQSASDQDVDWEDQAATAITSPFNVTATDVAHVPITATGAASQTADLFNVKQDGGAIVLGVAAAGQVKLTADPPSLGSLRIGVNGPTARAIGVKLASGHSALAMRIDDNSGNQLFAIDSDGTVNGANVGTDATTGNFYAPVLVLDNAESVPAGTPTGTVILRRPA
jgi:hypothetical protein